MTNWCKRLMILLLSMGLVLCASLPVFAKSTDNGTVVYVSDNEATFDPGGATYSRIICLKNSD